MMENEFMILGKYSFGIGDRFSHQGKPQLAALINAKEQGFDITPVWNKSHREHTIIGTNPADTRKEADDAVAAYGWDGSYFVDADHIGLNNVDGFIEPSDFFTLDVADYIGKTANKADVNSFVQKHKKYIGSLAIDGIDETFNISEEQIKAIADKFLLAVKQAGKTYRHITTAKSTDNFITEVSMDETDQPQTPVEMFFILAAIADEGIPAQTIAPKFTGRFNKGVDYVGDVTGFAKEFEEDVAVLAFAVKEFGLPENLKLSIHSASDKFSIYGPIAKALKKFDAGLHIKTAGTTWLEELIGLAAAGGNGLSIAKEVYAGALSRMDELCGPYETVIDIDREKLPTAQEVDKWDGERFASVLRHDQSCEHYNLNFRQLLHVAYKVAAEMGTRFSDALKKYENIIAQNVTENIYERHIRPLFIE
ncbi:MAG TPA: tagaturonate epimerase family protein [Sedimentisphaerales bacterium]|nr:tagaturonate epimerase family protein [Sedimentisphaerales bacterium]